MKLNITTKLLVILWVLLDGQLKIIKFNTTLQRKDKKLYK